MKHTQWTTHENEFIESCSGTRFNFRDNEHDTGYKKRDTGSEQVNKIGGHNSPLLKQKGAFSYDVMASIL